MLWEGEPLPDSVAKLNTLGIASIIFDPCGNKPTDGGFMSVMQQNIANLKQVFQ